jgi:hypothetical protein
MVSLPDLVTHNYHPARGIGGNICGLPPAEAERILDTMRALGRGLRPDYLRKRLRVEDWLIAAKDAKLGPTALRRPIYFFLGNFADGKDPSRPSALVMPLSAFPAGSLTFTTADSMTSHQLGVVGAESASGAAPHYGQVFTRSEIEDVVASLELPDEPWEGPFGAQRDLFIEVQVWDDQPIREWVAKTARHEVGAPVRVI